MPAGNRLVKKGLTRLRSKADSHGGAGACEPARMNSVPIYVAHADIEGQTFRNAFAAGGLHLQSCLVWKKNTMVLGRCGRHGRCGACPSSSPGRRRWGC